MMARVGDKDLSWLVDTGAALSVADSSLIEQIGAARFPKLPLANTLQVRGATGHEFKLVAMHMLPISVKGKTFHQAVLFVENLPSKAILGMDFLRTARATIEADTGQVHFNHEWQTQGKPRARETSVTVNAVYTSPELRPVKVRRATTIPPGYQKKVLVGTSRPSTVGVVISPKCMVDEAIVETTADGECWLVATNGADQPVGLDRGDVVGYFEEMDSPEVKPLQEVLAEVRVAKPKEATPEKKQFLRDSLQVGAASAEFWTLIDEFHDVFAEGPADMGFTDVMKHKISLKHDEPIHIKQFRIPWEHEKFIHDFVKDLLKKKCIRPSNSPYNFPVFCVKKPSGGLRIVNDYRLLNLAAKEDKYVIRSIQECIDTIGRRKSKFFSALDLTNSFWQLALEEGSRHLTAFTIPGWGRFEWVTTPMGLHGSPSTFARMMDHVMEGLAGVLTYIDDVLVNSPTLAEHMVDLKEAFVRLRRFGLKLNSKKCHLLQEEVAYLGFTLTREGVMPGLTKLKAVKEFPEPKSVKSVQEFLGLTNYFRHMINGFAVKASYLSRLLRKDSEWKEGPLPRDALEAFKVLRDELCAKPVLKYPRADLLFHLSTDAATGTAEGVGGGFGAMLAQVDEKGNEMVVAYASRSLKTHEKNYSAYLAELAAAAWAIDYFDVYLRGRKFILYTDHKPIEKMGAMQKKTLNRLMQQMNEFQFVIKHRDGILNVVPDALSRNPVDAVTTRARARAAEAATEPEVDRPIDSEVETRLEKARRAATELSADLEVPEEDLFALQAKDELCSALLRWLKKGELPKEPEKARIVSNFGRFCLLNDGIVYINTKSKGRPEAMLLVTPVPMRKDVVRAAHASMYSGHGGVAKTTLRVQSRFWWPGLAADVEKFVEGCIVCQRVNDPPAKYKNRAELHPLPVPDVPNFRVHIDLYGPLKTSESGKKSVMVCTDAFTKYVELVAIKDKEAVTVAQAYFERWICRFSAPRQTCSDRGKEFLNQLMDCLFERFNISRLTTSAFHPETNGQVERFNRTMRKYLQKVLENETLDWERWLAPLAIAYNTQIHQATKFSPFFLTFLHEPNLPNFDIDEPKLYSDNWVDEALIRLKRAYIMAKMNAEEAAAVYKHNYDVRSSKRQFKEGDPVLVHFPRGKFRGNCKLAQNWVDGYTIAQARGNDVYVCKPEDRRKRETVVHVNRLKLRKAEALREAQASELLELAKKNKSKKQLTQLGPESSAESEVEMSDSESEIEFEYERVPREQPVLEDEDVEMPTVVYSSTEEESEADEEIVHREGSKKRKAVGRPDGLPSRQAKLKARKSIYKQMSAGKRSRIDDSVLSPEREIREDDRRGISRKTVQLATKVLDDFVRLNLGEDSGSKARDKSKLVKDGGK